MSAGVGDSIVLRDADLFLCEVCLALLDWKCVHIGTKKNGFSRFSAVDLSDNTTFRNDYILDSQRIKLRGNIFYCLVLNTAVFRILVHVSSDPYHIVEIFLSFV